MAHRPAMHAPAPDVAPDTDGERGVVALEFAAIAPIMILMIIGAFDIARAVTIWQQTLAASESIAISAQSLAVQADSSTKLSPTNATLAMTAIYGVLPQIKSGLWSGTYSVTLSGVAFDSANPPNASIIWSVPLTKGNASLTQVKRNCGVVQQVAQMPEDSTNLSYIPTLNISIPSTLIVADVHYQFTPLFFNFITGPIDFWETYSFPALTGGPTQTVCFDYGNPADPYICPNYDPTLCIPPGS